MCQNFEYYIRTEWPNCVFEFHSRVEDILVILNVSLLLVLRTKLVLNKGTGDLFVW